MLLLINRLFPKQRRVDRLVAISTEDIIDRWITAEKGVINGTTLDLVLHSIDTFVHIKKNKV